MSGAAWREIAQRHSGTWWEDWAQWMEQNSGDLVDPPPTGNERYPTIGDAPGEYVHT